MNLALYLGLACSILCELLSGVLLIKGLLGEEAGIPKRWASAFIVISLAYILIVPAGLTTGSYIFTFLYIRYGYKRSWKDSGITVILSLLLGGIIEILSSFPFVFLLNGIGINTIKNLIAAVCSLILSCLLARFVPLWYLKKWCCRQEVIYILVLVFSLLLMFSAIIDFHMTLELGVGDYVYIFLAMILIGFLCLQLMRYRYEEKLRKKYFEAFCSVIDQIKRRQHKFQNQLDAVYSLHRIYGDYETLVREQRRYMGKLADYELPANVLVLENPIVIAHLYEKIGEAQEAGIRVRLKLSCSLSGCGLGDIHLVEILGTLLDNGIQDMQETGEGEYLYIEVKEEDGIQMSVANPHGKMKNEEMQRMYQKGYSTKGEDRGIGLYHVRKLVQRYKLGLVTENREIEGRNYLCFSLVLGGKART